MYTYIHIIYYINIYIYVDPVEYLRSGKLELQKMLNGAMESAAAPSDYLKTRRLDVRKMQSCAMEPSVGLEVSKDLKDT